MVDNKEYLKKQVYVHHFRTFCFSAVQFLFHQPFLCINCAIWHSQLMIFFLLRYILMLLYEYSIFFQAVNNPSWFSFKQMLSKMQLHPWQWKDLTLSTGRQQHAKKLGCFVAYNFFFVKLGKWPNLC